MSRCPRLQLFWPAALALMLAVAAPAAAQSRTTRPAPKATHRRPAIVVTANVGVSAGAKSFTQAVSLPLNAETESLTAQHGAKSAVVFDVGAAVELAPKVWIQASFAGANRDAGANISASLPHPLLFNQPRAISGSLSAVPHKEQAVHLDVMYALPMLKFADIKIMGGPSFFSVKQDLVSQVSYSESYPYDTASFTGASTTRLSKSVVGFNAGVDISRLLTPRIGVGAVIRYSGATVSFSDTSVGTADVKAGGVEAAGGVRVKF